MGKRGIIKIELDDSEIEMSFRDWGSMVKEMMVGVRNRTRKAPAFAKASDRERGETKILQNPSQLL